MFWANTKGRSYGKVRNMTISATITSKGQITIPKPIRDLLDLAKNDLLVFTVQKSKKVLITPVKTDIMSLYGSLKTNKK